MGTAVFAVPALERVAASHELIAVVTQPDRPKGRGARLRPTAVKVAAMAMSLPVLQPDRASDPYFLDAVRALEPDVVAVVAYGQILRPAFLDLPPHGCINVHGSLLPELRGAAPIQRAIMNGAVTTGVTTMRMDSGMDTGDIILQQALSIREDDSAGTLADRMAPLGAELLVETLSLIEGGAVSFTPQDSERATYAPPLRKDDAEIAWSEDAAAICRLVRGCNPSPGAFSFRRGSLLKVWEARLYQGVIASTARSGEVILGPRAELLVRTGQGCVELLVLQPENRARMAAIEYLRGYRVEAGEVLGEVRAPSV